MDDSQSWIDNDPFLRPYEEQIASRMAAAKAMQGRLTNNRCSLADFSAGHAYFGIQKSRTSWIFREWAPNARSLHLIGSFSAWQPCPDFKFTPLANGVWELFVPPERLKHGDYFRLCLSWEGGQAERIPAYARRVVQDQATGIFSAQIWDPPQPHTWKIPFFRRPTVPPLIYEAHVGMAQEAERIGTYQEFQKQVLPRVIDAGYNVLQLMAVQEHPYYASFGYHVSNYFAASSRFGTPEELKELVDAAHAAGIAVIMDLIHSHAVRNEAEGLSRFDGTLYQYFHTGERGEHRLWDSRCFDYGKPEVLHFLLSNCRFWLDEYKFDGFRFDGVTSMLYQHHGLGKAFTSYEDYFDKSVDEEALVYLALANQVIHSVRPDAITIAEDVSGMPGLATPWEKGGLGFNYRLAMGVPDYWVKLVKDVRDEDWHLGSLWYELNNRRKDEQTISYAESHDQALVGDQTLIFRLIGKDMYDYMAADRRNLAVDRGLALHKMIRLLTLATAGHGYLNFMGNEFGHPEWIDFPREGNNWSYRYARRQWSLRDDETLVYRFLADFDKAMLELSQLTHLLQDNLPRLRLIHETCQLLGFERSNLLFLFNFHSSRSYADYALRVTPGIYRLVLDSDALCFGGYGRLAANQMFEAQPEEKEELSLLKLYLPARSGLVLHRLKSF